MYNYIWGNQYNIDKSNKFVKEAAEIARARKLFERAEAVGAAAPVAVQQEQQ